MTFSDPVGWPSSAPRPSHAAAHTAASADAAAPEAASSEEQDLPPLPTLAPLPRIKPLAPMPRLPRDDEPAAARPVAPPPPAGHPAYHHPVADRQVTASPATQATSMTDIPEPGYGTTEQTPADTAAPDLAADAGADNEGPADARPWPTGDITTHHGDDAMVFGTRQVATPAFDTPTVTLPGSAVAPAGSGSAPVGRHASAASRADRGMLPLAPGLRVLVIGGAEPLGGMVTERLITAGHRLAVHGVTIPAELPEPADQAPQFLAFEPIPLSGDRADTEEMVHTVARAEVALGGLDALVVLPASAGGGVGLDADASTWADEWSLALTTEVLAASCATHIAARSFLARRKAGRIVLVTNGRDGSQSGAMPTAATRAAIDRLGSDLTRELGPHGIGVSVVSTGPGGATDFAVAQVADVVEALLSTPVLSGVTSRIG